MAKHKQEPVTDWIQEARDYAKAERALNIEKWVYITIGYHDPVHGTTRLYAFDLPRELYEKYRWVVRCRTARFQCDHPREYVQMWFSYYDKRTGLKFDHNSCLSRLAAAKAQITKAQRCIERHLEHQKQKYPMFYDESTDTELLAYREKLAKKIDNSEKLHESIRQAVIQHRAGNGTGNVNSVFH